jgi:hypothetical protein
MPPMKRTAKDTALRNFIYKIHWTVNSALSGALEKVSNDYLRGWAPAANAS